MANQESLQCLVGLCNCPVAAVFGISRRENPRSQKENFAQVSSQFPALL